MKIRTKIIVIIFLTVLITGITAITVSQTISKDMLRRKISNHLETTAESRARLVKAFLDKEKKLVLQMSESEVIKRLLRSSKTDVDYENRLNVVIKRLKNTASINKEIYDIMVLDTNGRVVASNIRERIGLDRSDALYFNIGERGFYIKDVYFSRFFKGEVSLAISARTSKNGVNDVTGVLVFRFKLDYLNNIIKNKKGLGKTGEAYIINREGYMITPSRFVADAVLKQKVDSPKLREWLELSEGEKAERKETNIYKNYIGRMVLGAHHRIEGMDWYLLAEIGEKEAFAPVARLTYTMFLILGVLLASGVMLSLHVSKTLTKPIEQLHQGSQEIEKGNLDYKVGTRSKDEIGQLSRAFDTMTTSLKESREKLEEYSTNLEKMVDKKTSDLNEKIKESEKQRVAILNIAQDLTEVNEKLEVEIAERRQTERELETYREHLELINQILRHDILNDLTALKSALRLYGNSNDEKFLKEAPRYVDRGVETIRRMRELESLISSRKDLEFYDIKAVIKEVIGNYSSIEFTIEGKGQVLADKALGSVIDNIISNAINHGKTDRIDITIGKQENFCEVRIADYGIGIPDDMKEHVFKKGFRYGETGHTGLGLHIVKKAMESYGGIVHIEDNIPKGTVFVLKLKRIG
jgi:signal transduction histidine kinase